MGKWSLAVNVAGVAPGGSNQKVPRGVYLAQIIGSERKQSANKNDVVIFDFKVTEPGPCMGMEEGIALGADLTKKGNLGNWRSALQSAAEFQGWPLTALEAPIALTDETMMGVTVAVFADPGEKLADDSWTQDNNRFITKGDYEKMKANGLPPKVERAPRKSKEEKKTDAAASTPVAAPPGFGSAQAQAPQTQAAPATAPAGFGAAPNGAASAPVGNPFGKPATA